MKKLLSSLFVLVALTIAVSANAQSPLSTLGIFNHVGIGVGVGTEGISVQAATPITRFLQLRAGVSFVPDITFNTTVDGEVNIDPVGTRNISVDLNGGVKRTTGEVILNVYPFPVGSFFIAGGLCFGGDNLVNITGHSAEVAQLSAEGYLEVGDYKLPIDKNGNVEGALRVKSTRPYLGLGWGKAVPGNRVNFAIELGVQFQGKPKLCTLENGVYTEIAETAGLDNDDTYQKIMKHLNVYPVLKFCINGRIF